MSWPRALAAAFHVLCLVATAALARPVCSLAQDTRPSSMTHSERPPAGSWRRGLVSVPAASVVGLGAVVVLASSVALARRARRPRR